MKFNVKKEEIKEKNKGKKSRGGSKGGGGKKKEDSEPYKVIKGGGSKRRYPNKEDWETTLEIVKKKARIPREEFEEMGGGRKNKILTRIAKLSRPDYEERQLNCDHCGRQLGVGYNVEFTEVHKYGEELLMCNDHTLKEFKEMLDKNGLKMFIHKRAEQRDTS